MVDIDVDVLVEERSNARWIVLTPRAVGLALPRIRADKPMLPTRGELVPPMR